MLIIIAHNVTEGGAVKGLSDYDVWIGVNTRPIWCGRVERHIRSTGAAALLRRIANTMDRLESDYLATCPLEKTLRRILSEKVVDNTEEI